MDENEHKNLVDSFCSNVQSPERMVRQRALKEFLDFARQKLTAAQAPEIFDSTYLHILRCYADRFEMIRNLAITLIGQLLDKLPANDFYLGYIVPVITRRIGQSEINEESEEIRLQLVEQLNSIVRKYADPKGSRGDPLLKSYDNIIDILVKTLKDPYPAVQKQSCELVKLLAESTPSMHYRAEALVSPATSILKHRHSANRIAAIEALGMLSLHISSNSDCVMKIIVDISPLLMDSVPFVRMTCGRVGCMMLLKLRDRYSLFPRILPLVLNCLTDETPVVNEDILPRWKEAGELYYTENETELSKLKLIDKTPANYPEEYERPTLPCRAIVQRSLRIVNLILHEMEEWTEGIRLHSTKLLKLVILHSEKAFSTHFLEVNPVLCKTCMDADMQVVNEALKAARLCGILLEYNTWSKHALVEFKKFPTLGHLRCLKTMYQSAGLDKFKDLVKIASLLTDTEVCHNLKQNYQLELLEFCNVLVTDYHRVFSANEIDGLGNETDKLKVEKMLYTIVLKVAAFCYEDVGPVRDRALEVLFKLDSEIAHIHERHLADVCGSLENLESSNSDSADSIVLLAGLVFMCGFRKSYHEILKTVLETALKHAIPQGKIKLFSSISIALLQWRETMLIPAAEQIMLLRDFIEDIIAPNMVWAAGRSAESVRSMATACFCSMSQGVENAVFITLLPERLKLLVGLIEDNSIATRAYALRTLLAMGPLDFESLKLIAFPIVTRLDDPSMEVREVAARCLGCLQLEADGTSETEHTHWEETLKPILTIMFLHLENPELKLRKVIIDSIARLVVHHRALIKGLVNEVAPGCPYKMDLDEILARS
ncbi:dynein axonemal assembly factor 5-like [Topomyia yanbarensis]|uniref:dynein axonemal assembly factor 5-like n=1 Tax=Topomyia yanbarensis TaxID=2498891 RepID=UPI00273B1DB5|nr:dynein axonemal assembly factor 5-like [Topomyia yanbarensis]XP_058839232.1 dynein axonemal assembly factor 5-like [Topomyia yanbarensis]XP_058839414.1 dynein axonemal assembly factor 5-like [Topomyia yanbarensis]XP_058839415.1 dynein axonemal assembly factor 5-like [Topomyia yanbarensis]